VVKSFMEARFTKNDIQKSLNEITQGLKENTNEYLKERRSSFSHLTILLATILGFTVGVATITGSINIILKIAWGFQITAILVGVFILILESETRYHRGFFAISAMLDVLRDIKNKGGIFDKESISLIMASAIKQLGGETQSKSSKERFFSWFTKNIKKIEIFFYSLFALSFIFLLISFF